MTDEKPSDELPQGLVSVQGRGVRDDIVDQGVGMVGPTHRPRADQAAQLGHEQQVTQLLAWGDRGTPLTEGRADLLTGAKGLVLQQLREQVESIAEPAGVVEAQLPVPTGHARQDPWAGQPEDPPEVFRCHEMPGGRRM